MMALHALFLLMLVDAACMVLTLLAAGSLLPSGLSVFADYAGATICTLLCYPLWFYILDAYRAGREDFRDTTGRMAVAGVLGCISSSTAAYVLDCTPFSKVMLVMTAVGTAILCLGWRYLYYRTSLRWGRPGRILLLGEDRDGVVRELLAEGLSRSVIVGFVGEERGGSASLSRLGAPSETLLVAREQDVSLIVVLPDTPLDDALAGELLAAKLAGIQVVDIRLLCEHMAQRLPLSQLDASWLLLNEGFSLNTRGSLRRLKRVMDVLCALLLLAAAAPVMLLAALAIALESPGPVIYCQRRVGLHEEPFTLYKFRSMREDAEMAGQPVWAARDDVRVTRCGAFLRATRMDELPQIWNVLAGDMSFIGPRPERPQFVRALKKSIPFYGLRHSVKPGLTGWAQVCYPYGASEEDARRKLEYDLYYIKNMSALLDIRIALRTLGVVLFPRGVR